jgi:endogenous inhibitor of DNA gyrase (YacG/DUF329 family)
LGTGPAIEREAATREAASRKLAKILPFTAAARTLGMTEHLLTSFTRDMLGEELTAHFMAWSPSSVDGCRRALHHLMNTVIEFNPMMTSTEVMSLIKVPGLYVKRCLAGVDGRARAAFAARHPEHGEDEHEDMAGGATAARGCLAGLRYANSNAGFEIDIECPVVHSFIKSMETREGVPAITLSIVEMYHFERVAMCTRSNYATKITAAASAVMAHAAMRHVSAQRTGNLKLVGSFLVGTIAADFKKSKNSGGKSKSGRPFCCSRVGITGTDHCARLVLDLNAWSAGEFLIPDNDSKTGDPREATKILDTPMSNARYKVAMQSVLRTTAYTAHAAYPPRSSEERVKSLTPHSIRHGLPAVARGRGEDASAVNEIGCWADSVGETLKKSQLEAAASSFDKLKMAGLYSAEGRGAAIPDIMERNMAAMRDWFSHNPPTDFPCVGGYELLTKAGIQASPRDAQGPDRLGDVIAIMSRDLARVTAAAKRKAKAVATTPTVETGEHGWPRVARRVRHKSG